MLRSPPYACRRRKLKTISESAKCASTSQTFHFPGPEAWLISAEDNWLSTSSSDSGVLANTEPAS